MSNEVTPSSSPDELKALGFVLFSSASGRIAQCTRCDRWFMWAGAPPNGTELTGGTTEREQSTPKMNQHLAYHREKDAQAAGLMPPAPQNTRPAPRKRKPAQKKKPARKIKKGSRR